MAGRVRTAHWKIPPNSCAHETLQPIATPCHDFPYFGSQTELRCSVIHNNLDITYCVVWLEEGVIVNGYNYVL